jgi:hypothetical protein
MISFNSTKRVSINEALSHPYLSSVREFSLEHVCWDPLTPVEPKDDSIEAITDCVREKMIQ